MLSRADLSQEHAELARLAATLGAQARSDRPDVAGVAGVRWQLTRKLLLHLANEDKLLYPKLKNGSDAVAARLAERFSDDMGGLAATYNAYVAKWSATRIEAEWPAFCTETQAIVAALSDRIAREERELYRHIH